MENIQTYKIVGKITAKSKSRYETFDRYVYRVKSDNEEIDYGLSIFDKEEGTRRAMKEGFVKDFAVGDLVEIVYVQNDKYKNIVAINFPKEEADKKYSVKSEEKIVPKVEVPKILTTEERIRKGQALNVASEQIASAYPEMSEEFLMKEIPKKILDLAGNIWEEMLRRKW